MKVLAFARLATNIIYVQVAVLTVFLVFFCFQTRSKGLIWVTIGTALILGKISGYIIAGIGKIYFFIFHTELIEQWSPATDVRGETLYSALNVYLIGSSIESLLGFSLCLFGAFLIYKEWKQGKFYQPKPPAE